MVRFQFKPPGGSKSTFQAGTQIAVNGDKTTWVFSIDTSVKGQYGYVIEMKDRSGNVVKHPAGKGNFIFFTVVDAPGTTQATTSTTPGATTTTEQTTGGTTQATTTLATTQAPPTVTTPPNDLGPIVDAARADIAQIINNFQGNLAAKFVRMGFHDCVGGCDG